MSAPEVDGTVSSSLRPQSLVRARSASVGMALRRKAADHPLRHPTGPRRSGASHEIRHRVHVVLLLLLLFPKQLRNHLRLRQRMVRCGRTRHARRTNARQSRRQPLSRLSQYLKHVGVRKLGLVQRAVRLQLRYVRLPLRLRLTYMSLMCR